MAASGKRRIVIGNRVSRRYSLSVGVWVLIGGAVTYLAVLPVGLREQAWMAGTALALLLLLRRLPKKGGWRVLFLCTTGFLLLRYLFWRTFFTLGFDDPFSFAASLTLYGAELYGIAMFLLSALVNVRPITHRQPGLEAVEWPPVDVLIPTYDEPLEVVKTTLVAAVSMDYPPHLLNVYLLDDGATEARLSDPDPWRAGRARKRRQQMSRLCGRLGVRYLSRKDNEHAKAGNLNAALPRISGELIVVLDCDHVPTMDFLRETVPPLVENPRLFLVQTPHFFVTPDPIEKNLGLFNRMPSENDMFYGAVQPGLDFWQASFFCGSAAVLRRRALLENGGFSGLSVTEDAETALSLHARGWKSRYLLKPLISGLQPETFTGFISQRSRWAQGMVQLFLRKNPLRQQGLDDGQKLAYLNCMLFWFFPFARVVFLLAPLCFLLFGLKIYDAGIEEIAAYTLPYLAALILTANYLFGRVRWFLISEIYESMQSFFSLKAVVNTLRHPDRPEFIVTPKGKRLEKDFISPLVRPFYLLLCLLGLGFFAAAWRWGLYPEQRSLILITALWNGFGFLIVIASLGALYERRQRRGHPRLPAGDLPAELIIGADPVPVSIHDISTGGAALKGAGGRPGRRGVLRLRHPLLDECCRFPVEIVARHPSPEGGMTGIRFHPESLEQYRQIVLLVHGDSRRWEEILARRERDVGILPAAGFLLACGFRQAGRHVSSLFSAFLNRMKRERHEAKAVFSPPDSGIASLPLRAGEGGAGHSFGEIDDAPGFDPAEESVR